jgi:hypothetical protein
MKKGEAQHVCPWSVQYNDGEHHHHQQQQCVEMSWSCCNNDRRNNSTAVNIELIPTTTIWTYGATTGGKIETA